MEKKTKKTATKQVKFYKATITYGNYGNRIEKTYKSKYWLIKELKYLKFPYSKIDDISRTTWNSNGVKYTLNIFW